MSYRMIAIAAGLALGLTGCAEQYQAQQPPPQQDALTTVTATPTPVNTNQSTATAEPATGANSSGGQDFLDAAEELPEDLQEPENTSSDLHERPELPAEAWEHTQEGAALFATHYVELLNYTGVHPETGILERWGGEDCISCRNYEDNVKAMVDKGATQTHQAITIEDSSAVRQPGNYVVTVDILVDEYQIVTDSGEVLYSQQQDSAGLVFMLTPDMPWIIEGIYIRPSQ